MKNGLLTGLAFAALRMADSPLLGDEIGWITAVGIAVPLYMSLLFVTALMAAPSKMDFEAEEKYKDDRTEWWEQRRRIEGEREGHADEVTRTGAALARMQAESLARQAAKPNLQIKKYQDGHGRCFAVVMNEGGKAECTAQVLHAPGPNPLESGMWGDMQWGQDADKGLRVTIPKDGFDYILLGRVDPDPVVTGRTFQVRYLRAGTELSATGMEESERREGVLYHLRVYTDPASDNVAVATFRISDAGFDLVLFQNSA